MILRPIASPLPNGSGFVPAWEAILRAQNVQALDYWMIAQADHAELAGQIAAALGAEWLPKLSPDAIAGIAAHDAGWKPVDARLIPEAIERKQRPVPFFGVSPADAAAVGLGSIERAAQLSPLSGILVSSHFSRLAQERVRGGFGGAIQDPPEVKQRLRAFADSEAQRRARLLPRQPHSPEEIERLTDVLQLCDLFSLYVCCGTGENIALPQQFGAVAPRIVSDHGGAVCRIEPQALARPLHLSVKARRWSDAAEEMLNYVVN